MWTQPRQAVYTDAFFAAFRRVRDPVTRAAIVARVERAKHGHYGDFKIIGGGLHELRVNRGPGYRVYFGVRGSTEIVLLGVGSKGSQARDIRRAASLWQRLRGGDG
jgi:putative addiction module killer protein